MEKLKSNEFSDLSVGMNVEITQNKRDVFASPNDFLYKAGTKGTISSIETTPPHVRIKTATEEIIPVFDRSHIKIA